MVAPWFVEAPL